MSTAEPASEQPEPLTWVDAIRESSRTLSAHNFIGTSGRIKRNAYCAG
jgi:hypothetical protein